MAENAVFAKVGVDYHLEAENAKLKQMLAQGKLDKVMLKDVLSKTWLSQRTVDGSSHISRPSIRLASGGPAG